MCTWLADIAMKVFLTLVAALTFPRSSVLKPESNAVHKQWTVRTEHTALQQQEFITNHMTNSCKHVCKRAPDQVLTFDHILTTLNHHARFKLHRNGFCIFDIHTLNTREWKICTCLFLDFRKISKNLSINQSTLNKKLQHRLVWWVGELGICRFVLAILQVWEWYHMKGVIPKPEVKCVGGASVLDQSCHFK